MIKVPILGIEIDNLNLAEVVGRINDLVQQRRPSLIVTANPEIIMRARQDRSFANCLKAAEVVTADGIGLIIAAELLGTPLKERVTGIDLITELFRESQSKNYRFYFVGAKPGIAEKAALNIREKFPQIEIVGVRHGYFQDDSAIISDILDKKPDILLAALGMGKQESWVRERVIPAGVPVSIGVGGSFDVFAGEAKRAPRWMQRAGVEWLYRLFKQPSRFWRMLELPKFLTAVIYSRFIR
ncbi:MAG: WecB/TagA/CpsF family glycosyltransferase [Thermincola sp.]|jgi:N-acetylglucosaminyldiphosphoundecaprenol N-acetyl-beta-D-mannosaminyltransferase|nr:WecB/TagA/CpsF family glycosyltransferase [Thermincola sp.]MDT3703422.1 WecB/TagA/CpsF family glycosyltransferase [Thermincola sp.]